MSSAYNDFITFKRNKEAQRENEYDDAVALHELEAVATSTNQLTSALIESAAFVQQTNDIYTRIAQFLDSKDYTQLPVIMGEANALLDQRRSRASEIPALVKRVGTIPHAVKTIVEEFHTDESQTQELHALAATGLAAEGLVHEISDVVHALLNALSDLDKISYVLNIKNAKFLGNIKSAQAFGRDIVNRIRFLDPMLRNVRATRENIDANEWLARYKKHKQWSSSRRHNAYDRATG